MKYINALKSEFKKLHTPTKEQVMKSTVLVMTSSAILSLIIFGLSSGVTQLIGLAIK